MQHKKFKMLSPKKENTDPIRGSFKDHLQESPLTGSILYQHTQTNIHSDREFKI